MFSPRLFICKAERKDQAELWRLWNQPAVRQYLFAGAEISSAFAAETLSLFTDGNVGAHGLWTARTIRSARLVGCGWLLPSLSSPAVLAPESMNLMVSMAAVACRQGYGTEFAVQLLHLAFGTASQVMAECADGDRQAERLVRKLGFSRTNTPASTPAGLACHVLVKRQFIARQGLMRA